MIKKFMAFILCLLLTLSLMACSGGKIQTSSTTEETELPDSVPIELEQSDKNTNSEDEAVTVQRYAVGDIILADGSVATADLTVIDSGNLPIAVIAGFTDDGTAYNGRRMALWATGLNLRISYAHRIRLQLFPVIRTAVTTGMSFSRTMPGVLRMPQRTILRFTS